jgi:N-alpha-acetyl-L-2,4-diaminobutyrate deacetylase
MDNTASAETFRADSYRRGAKYAIDIEGIPILLVRGSSHGATLSVTAGIHGDEYEGIRAILDLVRDLNPSDMCGDLLAAPCANVAAFEAGARSTPQDGLNLARVFPGSPDGSHTERVAWRIDQAVIRHGNLFLDLHSGGTKFLMPSMVGYWTGDPRARDAAYAFGAPVLWAHPEMPPGRTLSAAAARGIPSLYTEARGAGRIDPRDLALFRNGMINLMRYLRILAGEPARTACEVFLEGDGNTDAGISSPHGGFFIPAVDLLDEVNAGDVLGRVVTLSGECLDEVRAPRGGVVGLLHACPMYRAGEPLVLLTTRKDRA